MANPVNELAVVQDQFQLMAMAAEVQDENEARLNNNFAAFFNEIKNNMAAMSDRISVLENEKATATINAETIAKAHLSEKQAFIEQIAGQNLQITELRENQAKLSQENLDLKENLDIIREAYKYHTHCTTLYCNGGIYNIANKAFGSTGPSIAIKDLDIVRKEREEALALENYQKSAEGISSSKSTS